MSQESLYRKLARQPPRPPVDGSRTAPTAHAAPAAGAVRHPSPAAPTNGVSSKPPYLDCAANVQATACTERIFGWLKG